MVTKRLKRKPKQARSEETMGVIIEAAAQVLLEQDYPNCSTNKIAERAGVSVGSIYQYFDNKAEIYAKALERYLERLVASVGEVSTDPSVDSLSMGEELCRRTLQLWPEGPKFLRKLRQVPDAHFQEKMDVTKLVLVEHLRNLVRRRGDQLTVADQDTAFKIVLDAAEGVFVNSDPELPIDVRARELSLLINRYLMGTI